MTKTTASGWRWLGRVGLIMLACAAVTGAAWVYWAHEINRRCDAAIAAMRACDEKVLLSELQLPQGTIPDDQNGAWYLSQAGNSLTPAAAPSGSATRPSVGTSAWRTTAQQNVAGNAKALELAHKARACSEVRWPTVPGSGWPPVPWFTNQASLARLLRDAAILHHECGREREAIERWRDIENQSQMVAREQPQYLIGGLVSLIVQDIGTESLGEIVSGVRIGSDGLDSDTVRSVIKQLQNDRWIRERVAQGFLTERLNQTNWYLTGGLAPLPWMLRPASQLSQLHNWGVLGDTANAIRECGPRPSRSVAADVDEERLFGLGVTAQFSEFGDDVIRYTFHRRAIAVILAARLYQQDHGRYPASLNELTPGYLGELPMDPRTGDQTAIGYLLEPDGERPLVYSVGSSKASLERIRREIPKTRTGGSATWPHDRIVFFDVTDWTPPASTTQCNDDQVKKAEYPR